MVDEAGHWPAERTDANRRTDVAVRLNWPGIRIGKAGGKRHSVPTAPGVGSLDHFGAEQAVAGALGVRAGGEGEHVKVTMKADDITRIEVAVVTAPNLIVTIG